MKKNRKTADFLCGKLSSWLSRFDSRISRLKVIKSEKKIAVDRRKYIIDKT